MEASIDKVARHDPAVTQFCVLYRGVTEEQMVRLIDALKPNQYVRKPDFFNAPHTPAVCRELASLFRVDKVIQYVRLPQGMINNDFALIAESLHDNTAVQTLDLNDCNIDGRQGGEIIWLLLLNNQSITKLDLSCNFRLGSEGTARVAQALRSDRCVLKELLLWKCGIGNEGF